MSNNEINLPFPQEVLKKALPAEGTSVKLGEEAFTKFEYQGKAYVMHWVPAIHVLVTAGFEDIDKEFALLNERKTKMDTLLSKFNELTAVPMGHLSVAKSE